MSQRSRPPAGALRDFQELGPLGEGSYSSVHHVLRRSDGREYALKKVKLPQLSEKEKDNALNEVRLLASLRSEYVIAYKEAFWDDASECLCIVMEMADGGDLYQKIQERESRKQYFPEQAVWRVLIGLCLGLRALHSHQPPILHRDLKSANVFLTRRGDPKLGDLNVSKVAKRGMLYTQTGTPYYASPEVWKDMPYDEKSDIWGLGCVIYEMCALRPPFRAEDMESLYRKVLRGNYSRIPNCYSNDLHQVVQMLLQKRPAKRPGVWQLLNHEVVQRHMHLAIPDNGADAAGGGTLLNTIKLPEGGLDLAGVLPGLLPKAQYDTGLTPRESSSCGDAAGGAPSARSVDPASARQEAKPSARAGTRAAPPQYEELRENECHEPSERGARPEERPRPRRERAKPHEERAQYEERRPTERARADDRAPQVERRRDDAARRERRSSARASAAARARALPEIGRQDEARRRPHKGPAAPRETPSLEAAYGAPARERRERHRDRPGRVDRRDPPRGSAAGVKLPALAGAALA